MAQKAVLHKKYQNSTYVSGNTVRKLNTAQPAVEVPQRQPERTKEEQKQRAERQRQLHHTNKMNFLYTMAVSGIVAVIFTICYQYLNLQSEVKANAAETAQLQTQLSSMISENNEEEMEMNAGIDYDAIYNTAVNELGMVYPEKSQVIPYEAGVSEYVKQYADIPAAK